MDTATLVSEYVDEGKRLINHLQSNGFEVAVALWVLTSEEGLWFLYIASPVVDADGPAKAYRKLYAEFSQCQLHWLSRSDIRLIGKSDAITVDAIDYQSSTLPTRFGGRKLGNLIIEEAYIYPK